MGGDCGNQSSEILPLEIDSERSSVNSDSEIPPLCKGDKSCDDFTCDRPSILSSPCFLYLKRRDKVRNKILQNYQNTESRVEVLVEAKGKLLSYRPGAWIEEVGRLRRTDYEIPKTTTLLLVGPRRSGKSSLVNKISRVLEDGRFSVDRAQVSYGLSPGEGTCFLQEYMIPRDSNSFCIYDTRSLSTNSVENFKELKDWMINGIQHGQKIVRCSDDRLTSDSIKQRAHHAHSCHSVKRMVNFVIFVVDAHSVLKSMVNNEDAYINFISRTFCYPYLSFKDVLWIRAFPPASFVLFAPCNGSISLSSFFQRLTSSVASHKLHKVLKTFVPKNRFLTDDKPAIVVTHGDELVLSDRAEVCIFLGDLLGVPPEQIFDIPDDSDVMMELAVTNLLLSCLQRADRNLPVKRKHPLFKIRDFKFQLITVVLVLLLASLIGWIARYPPQQPSSFLEWHAIRPSTRVVWEAIRPSGRTISWSRIRHLWL